MAKRFIVTGDQYRVVSRQMRDILKNLDHKKGSLLDPELIKMELQKIAGGKLNRSETKLSVSTNQLISQSLVSQTKYFRLIMSAKNLQLGCSSIRLIANATDVFKSGIDSDFNNYGLNMLSKSSTPARIYGYELVKGGIFKDMFLSFGVDLEKLWSRQGQVIDICSVYAKHLCQNGNANFFLIKKDEDKPATEDNLFVVSVYVVGGGLYARVRRFSFVSGWDGDDGRRFFCPQLLVA